MFLNLFTLIIGLLPWMLGILILYALLYRPNTWQVSHHLVVTGTGAYAGYLTLAFLMFLLQRWEHPVFSSWLIACSILMVLGCWLLGRISSTKITRTEELSNPGKTMTSRWLLVSLTMWLVPVVLFVLWEVMHRPAMTWDTLFFWADHGHEFMIDQFQGDGQRVMSARTHPPTIKYVGVWGAFAMLGRSGTWLYTPWAAVYLGVILTSLGLGRLLAGNWVAGLVAALFLATAPIIQGHASLGGYADLWIGSGLFFVLAWVTLCVEAPIANIWHRVLLVIILIISTAFLKGNAIAYTMILVASLAGGWLSNKLGWTSWIALLTALALALMWVLSRGFDVSFADYRMAFLPNDRLLVLGYRSAAISHNSWLDITHNFGHAWLIKSSFYLGFLISPLLIIIAVMNRNCRQHWPLKSGLLLFGGLLAFFTLGQHLATASLFSVSEPNSDTSLSRFSQIMLFTITPVALIVWSKIIKKRVS